ncbi:MAG: hypothetical protein DWQ05_00245 [Calditrichaeota bacterium]|nr:MAG: hypothetical protein DWQ05_00245 [Calditrichota bacterium]
MISLKSKAYALLVLFFLFAASGQNLLGQTRSVSNQRLLQEFNLLKQKIETAKQLLSDYSDQRIISLIQTADQKRAEAQKFWNEKQFVKAWTAVQVGLKNINAALVFLLREPLQLQEKQLAVLLQRIEQFPDKTRLKDAEILYRQAKEKETLAKRAVGSGDYAKAIELYRLGISLANKALTTFDKNQILLVEQSRFLETASRVREAIDASNNSSARRVYEQAIKQGKNAANAYRNGQTAAAAGLYTEGMKLLLRAFDLASVGTKVNDHDLRVELTAVNDLLQNAQNTFGDRSARGVKIMLNRAQKSALKAEAALERGDYQIAKAQLKFARGIINKLYRQAAGQTVRGDERAVSELQRLRAEIEEVSMRLGSTGSPETKEFMHYARVGANRAQRAIDNGRYNLALNRILVAQRFLAKAEYDTQAQKNTISEQMAAAQIALLEQALQQSEISESNDQFVKSLLNEANRMKVQANQRLSDQQYALAFELADIGLVLINKALRAAQNQ